MKQNAKKLLTLIMVTLMLAVFVGCQSADSSQTTSSEAPSSESADSSEDTATEETGLVDREGKPFTAPQSVDKIISVSPSITETLVALGLGDNIIAVDTYSVGIEGIAEDLPTYDMMALDIESIVAMEPDIIFATGMTRVEGEDPFKPATDMGVVMSYVPASTSIEGIKEDIIFLGEATGTQDKAQQIVTDLEADIATIVETIGEDTANKSVYFEIAPLPNLYSFGTGTFLNEIIELLGCENILADQESWVAVSPEVILDKNPDIIFTSVYYTEDPAAEIIARDGWEAVTAVENGDVYYITENSGRSNQNIITAIEEMAKAIYPDKF